MMNLANSLRQGALKQYTIAVLDDTSYDRNYICNHLNKAGYRTLAAKTPQECLDLVEKNHIDLIVSDVCMDGSDGLDLSMHISNLREKYQQNLPPVILVSSSLFFSDEAAEANGADLFCSKCNISTDLVRKVRSLLK